MWQKESTQEGETRQGTASQGRGRQEGGCKESCMWDGRARLLSRQVRAFHMKWGSGRAASFESRDLGEKGRSGAAPLQEQEEARSGAPWKAVSTQAESRAKSLQG